MSEAPLTGPSALPPHSLWAMFIRAWRPACGWMIALILARGGVVPLVQVARGLPVEPIDWVGLAALAGILVAARSFDKQQGTA